MVSSLTRLSSGGLSTDGDQSVPAYVQALLEQTAESLENLQRTLARGEESNIASNASLIKLTESLGSLGDQMRTEQNLLVKLTENQNDLKTALVRIATDGMNVGGAIEDATQKHIRNLDIHVASLLQEMSAGRNDIIKQLRSEIKLLPRTIAASSRDP